MRDFKRKARLIWLILTDRYTASTIKGIWWMWDGETTIIHGPFRNLPEELQ